MTVPDNVQVSYLMFFFFIQAPPQVPMAIYIELKVEK